jgi:radical SAM superfamily enzyme YgiQ (UPF0313 family)
VDAFRRFSETAKEIIVNAEIPGVEAKEIDVNLKGNVLTIKGERKREHEEKEENSPKLRGFALDNRAITDPSPSWIRTILHQRLPNAIRNKTCFF